MGSLAEANYGFPCVSINKGNRPRKRSKNKVLSLARFRINTVVQTVAFEISKIQFLLKSNQKPCDGDTDCCTEGQEYHLNTNRNSLCSQLSSISTQTISSLAVSKRSSITNIFRSPPLTVLDDNIILRIASFLDGISVHLLSQSCSSIRRLLRNNQYMLPKRQASSYEVFISVNNSTKLVDVRALRIGRSLKCQVYVARTLNDLIPDFLCFSSRVIFENGVNVLDWVPELLMLHSEGILVPTGFVFNGGAMSKGNNVAGADLRGFTESSFIMFISRFYPQLQEVQLATTRLFKPKGRECRLLSLISMVSVFGITYERPALRYSFHDLSKIIQFWRHDRLSQSCTVYMRTPTEATPSSWSKLYGVQIDDEYNPHKISISHSVFPKFSLIFYFH